MILAKTTKKQDNGNIVQKAKNFGVNVISLEEMNLELHPIVYVTKACPTMLHQSKWESYDHHSSRLLIVVSATGL